jgi:hypothetical protein
MIICVGNTRIERVFTEVMRGKGDIPNEMVFSDFTKENQDHSLTILQEHGRHVISIYFYS